MRWINKPDGYDSAMIGRAYVFSAMYSCPRQIPKI
jgi:hypothetical protein